MQKLVWAGEILMNDRGDDVMGRINEEYVVLLAIW